jgi:hypothetical protein
MLFYSEHLAFNSFDVRRKKTNYVDGSAAWSYLHQERGGEEEEERGVEQPSHSPVY